MLDVQLSYDWLSELLLKESPSDADWSYIDTLKQKYDPLARQAQIETLAGAISLCELPKRYERSNKGDYWEFIQLTPYPKTPVPIRAFTRLLAAKRFKIPFKWFVLINQHIVSPRIEYLPQETIYVDKKVVEYYKPVYSTSEDPILLGLIDCGKGMGIPYRIDSWKHKQE